MIVLIIQGIADHAPPPISPVPSTEQFLEIHNPYPHPLQWHLDSVASPFVKDVSMCTAVTVVWGLVFEVFTNYEKFVLVIKSCTLVKSLSRSDVQ